MTSTQNHDAIITGASRAGIFLGSALTHAGWRTALIERDRLRGTCVNVGCTQTKTMVASARVANLAGRAVAPIIPLALIIPTVFLLIGGTGL
jgi:pyruvate/2-oxoglutarate dehydrogenase complex dihydrolipoamide dehydrogenase (E3) component